MQARRPPKARCRTAYTMRLRTGPRSKNSRVEAVRKTGATGLEPATPGMTGRSWRLRAERAYAGICRVSRVLRPCRWGDTRVRSGASGSLVRDQRGMSSCPSGQRQRDVRGTPLRANGSQRRSRCDTLAPFPFSDDAGTEDKAGRGAPGTKARARRRNRPKISDRACPLVPALVFPQRDVAFTSAFAATTITRHGAFFRTC